MVELRSTEKRIVPLEKVTVAGKEIATASLPMGLRLNSDVGIVHAAGLEARRVHIDNFTCHPRAIITPGGEYLLMFAAGDLHYGWARKKCKGNSMLAVRSKDRGRTWSQPSLAWDIPYSQHAPIPFISRGNPMRIYSFGTEPRHDVYDGEENAAIGYRSSDDDGRTWSEVTLIRPQNDPDFRAMSAMRMCQTQDGAWLLGAHAGVWDKGNVTTEQYILRSADEGKSWQVLPGPRPHGWALPEWKRMDEGRPIHLGGNRVLLMVRTPAGHLWELRSSDGGCTWSPPRPTSLAHPDAPPMLFHLADGKTLAAFHHNNTLTGSCTHQARAELWVSLSGDDGMTWSEPRFVLANAAEPGVLPGWNHSSPMVSYCDLLVDGEDLHLFVDHQIRQVVHVHFRQADLGRLPTRAEVLG